MSTAIAKNLMAEMKLLGMLGAFEKALNDATRDQSSYSELIDALLQAESDYRQERKTGYRIKAARFTLRPAFEDIDFTASRSINKTQIKELYSLQWLHDARPVLLIGQTGVGKTFIAQAAGLHACACGKSVLYMTLTTWLENLALARSSGTYLRYRDKLAKPDLVILDRQELENTDRSNAFVFKNRAGGQLTRFGVRYLLRKYLPDYLSPARRRKIHPHSLRHTTAIHLLKSGVDFGTISQFLGHSGLQTTMRYARADLDLKRQALAQVFPDVLGAPKAGGMALHGTELTRWLRRL